MRDLCFRVLVLRPPFKRPSVRIAGLGGLGCHTRFSFKILFTFVIVSGRTQFFLVLVARFSKK